MASGTLSPYTDVSNPQSMCGFREAKPPSYDAGAGGAPEHQYASDSKGNPPPIAGATGSLSNRLEAAVSPIPASPNFMGTAIAPILATSKPTLPSDAEDPEPNAMILVMGMRGSGKSTFINKLSGKDVAAVGDGPTPCTQLCQVFTVRFGRTKVLLIDTPGYDKTTALENIVSSGISKILAQQYQRGVSLRGIIYLHRITESHIIGNASSILKVFRSICGPGDTLLQNVILATTRWQLKQVTEEKGAAQEGTLRNLWGQMLDHKSTLWRYYGDRASGLTILSRILANDDVPRETRAELIEKGMVLERKLCLKSQIGKLQRELAALSSN